MSTEVSPPIAASNLTTAKLYTSQVAHLIDPQTPLLPDQTRERQPSLCKTRPYWPGLWITDDVDDLPLCGNCKAVQEASFSVGQP